MRRFSLVLMAIGLSVVAASAQQRALSPILMDTGGSRIADGLQDDRVGDRPIAQEDTTLRKGRELKQGEAVVFIRPPPQTEASSSRVRARALMQEDRARIKRVIALANGP